MFLGIQKRQGWGVLLLLLAPLVLNTLAIWQDMGAASLLAMWNHTYIPPLHPAPYNPLPAIFLKLILLILPLGAFAWFLMWITNQKFFRAQKTGWRLMEIMLAAVLLAGMFALGSGNIMPLVWLPEFHDYLLGAPRSDWMIGCSWGVIFPLTALGWGWMAFLHEKVDRSKQS